MKKEYEKKYLLSRSEYERLLNILGGRENQKLQVNYYYDTDDRFFRENNITCRIRQVDGGFRGMLKIHKRGVSEEHGFFISDLPSHLELCDKRLALMGSLCTLRLCVGLGERVRIMLDKSVYLGNTDYELEIEYAEGAEASALESEKMIANLLAARPTESEISKSERFFRRLELLENDRYPETAIDIEGLVI